MKQVTEKRVVMELVGMDGDAFAILGNFQHAARKQGWQREEIEQVIEEATSGDYNHLLATIMNHTTSPGDEYDDY